MEQMNSFFDVGRTIECGHCHPDKYSLPTLKCECICHDKEITNSTPSWKEKFKDMFVSQSHINLSGKYSEEDIETIHGEKEVIDKLITFISQVAKEEYVKGYADGIKHHTQNI